MLDVTISIKLPEWADNIVKLYGAVIKVRDIRKGESGVKDLIDISTSGSNMNSVIDYMVESGTSLPGGIVAMGHERASAVVDAGSCDFCSEVSNIDAFLVESELIKDGELYLTFLIPYESILSDLVGRLDKKNIYYKIIKKKIMGEKGDITARQEYIVRMALELGFFEFPKKINLEELSERINISSTTLSEIIRRGSKHIISMYFTKSR